MESLLKYIDTVLALGSESCTQCLIEELADENSEITDSLARFQVAYEWLGQLPRSEEEFHEAFADFMTRIVKMALFSAELMHRPGVRWTDQASTTTVPVVISPN